MNTTRRTSNYTVTVDTYGNDMDPILDALRTAVTAAGRIVTNSRAYGNTAEVSYRASSDDDASTFADDLIDVIRPTAAIRRYRITTGLGAHAREVTI